MNSAFSKDLFGRVPIVGILRGLDFRHIQPVVEAARAGGLTNLEITMNTPGAAQQIQCARELAGPKLNVGAGTVTSLELLNRAVDAGASFVVTPTVQEDVIRRCVTMGIPVFPGAFTPTEIAKAWDLGATVVKVFPAEFLGPAYVRSLKGPLPQVRLMPTGGVDLVTLPEYFKAGADAVGVGTPLFKPDRIASEDWSWLQQQARAFVEVLNRGWTRISPETTG